MNTQITLAWISRSGAHCTQHIPAETVEARILRFFKQRIEAVAWLGDDRRRVIASVVPPNGGQLEPSQFDHWTWWFEKPPYC